MNKKVAELALKTVEIFVVTMATTVAAKTAEVVASKIDKKKEKV